MLARKKDKILYTLAILGDILENIGTVFGLLPASYEQMYGYIPPKYRRHHFLLSLRRNLKAGNIEKVNINGKICLRITRKGNNKFVRNFPITQFANIKWDKKWRIIFFDIEEINRKNRILLRYKLKSLGFAQMQKSVYLTPFNIEVEMKDFLSSNGFGNDVKLFVTEQVYLSEAKELSENLWQISELNKKYQNIYKHLIVENNLNKIKELKSGFIDLLLSDPYLPTELLPKPWYKDKITSLLKHKSYK